MRWNSLFWYGIAENDDGTLVLRLFTNYDWHIYGEEIDTEDTN